MRRKRFKGVRGIRKFALIKKDLSRETNITLRPEASEYSYERRSVTSMNLLYNPSWSHACRNQAGSRIAPEKGVYLKDEGVNKITHLALWSGVVGTIKSSTTAVSDGSMCSAMLSENRCNPKIIVE